jgi:hypothetical protein
MAIERSIKDYRIEFPMPGLLRRDSNKKTMKSAKGSQQNGTQINFKKSIDMSDKIQKKISGTCASSKEGDKQHK